MSAESNKAMVRVMYERLAAGDARPFWDAFADDVEYRIIGTTVASGTFRGKRAFIDGVMKPLGRVMQGSLVLTPVRIVGEGDVVVVELTGRGTTRVGVAYDNVYCQVLEVVDGKITKLTEYLDTELVTSVFGQPNAASNT